MTEEITKSINEMVEILRKSDDGSVYDDHKAALVPVMEILGKVVGMVQTLDNRIRALELDKPVVMVGTMDRMGV